MKDIEFDYLMEILLEIKGIGKQTASRIINLKEDFSEFNQVSSAGLDKIKFINSEKRERVLERIKTIDFSETIEVLYTQKILMDFLDTQFENLKNLKLDDLEINVLLVKALGFTTAEETIEFYLYQRITRGAVTSWGQKALEDLCRVAGAEKIPTEENVEVSGKRFDLKKRLDGTNYFIQLKSGPNTMNVGMVDSLNEMIKKIEEKDSEALGILGMTYGTKSQISSQIRGKLADFERRAFIGEDFWKLLSGNEHYYGELIKLIDHLSEKFKEKYERTFLVLVKEKKSQLASQWKEKYGDVGEKGLKKFVAQFTSD